MLSKEHLLKTGITARVLMVVWAAYSLSATAEMEVSPYSKSVLFFSFFSLSVTLFNLC